MQAIDESKIISEYIHTKSISKVSNKSGMSCSKIRKILLNNNIEVVFKNVKNLPNVEKAIEEYSSGLSVNKIHKKYGFDHNVFKGILKKRNIEYVNRAKEPSRGDIVLIRKFHDEIIKTYSDIKNVKRTSEQFGVKECNLYRYLKQNKLLQRSKEHICKNVEDTLKHVIYDFYVKENLNLSDISKRVGITKYNVKKILVSNFGIQCIRPRSIVITDMNYTKEHQIKCHNGLLRRKQYTLPSGNTIRVQGYEDDFLNFVFKNTKLTEEDFNFKNRLKIELCKERVKNKNYYPDFYLERYNLVIEIKSEYIYNLQIDLNKKKEIKTKESGFLFMLIKDKDYSKFNKFLKIHNLLK